MLTGVDCRSARCLPEKARLRLSDSGNLYPQVEPNGSRRWFWKYTAGGKEKRISLGHYIETECSKVQTSLKAAREARGTARSLHRTGVDPTQKKQLDKLANQTSADVTFEAVARDLHATKSDAWGPRYFERWIERMGKDLSPWIGSLPLPQISAPLLLQTLRRIESRAANDTAHALRQTSGQVFRYGMATGRCERNPAADLHGALRPFIVKHMAAVLEPTGVGALMRSIAEYSGQPLTRAALGLSAMLFQRPRQHSPHGMARNRSRGEALDDPGSQDEAHCARKIERTTTLRSFSTESRADTSRSASDDWAQRICFSQSAHR